MSNDCDQKEKTSFSLADLGISHDKATTLLLAIAVQAEDVNMFDRILIEAKNAR